MIPDAAHINSMMNHYFLLMGFEELNISA